MAELMTVSGDVLLLDEEDVALFEGKRLYTLRTQRLTYATYAIKTPGRSQKSGLAHRLIMNAPEGVKVDHKNRNGMDCRKENLRFATTAQNGANQRAQEGRSSRFKGVALAGKPPRWRATARADGIDHRLGMFHSEEDAARAYDRAALDLWGEFAGLNFPEETPPSLEEIAALRIPYIKGRSRFRGVSWQEQHQRWLVRATVDGRTICSGRFKDEEDAAYVYDLVAREAGAPPSRYNFPDAPIETVEARAAQAMGEAYLLARGASSPYRGVSWYSMEQCWRAAIHINRKTIILGNFGDEEAAARAYDVAAIKAWGADALLRLNFPLPA